MARQPQTPRQLPQGTPISRSVEPVEDAIGTGTGEQGRELFGAEATAALNKAFEFFREFDRAIANQRIVDLAKHESQGALHAVPSSSANASETPEK